MRMKKKIRWIVLIVYLFMPLTNYAQLRMSDNHVNWETKNLFYNMHRLSNTGCMVGHHDGLAYGVNWNRELGRSDYKDVTGHYPAMFGWDFIELERSSTDDLKSQRLQEMKEYMMLAYQLGAINTVCWHMDNPVTGESAWDVSVKNVVSTILPGGEYHEKYKQWLDRMVWYISALKNKDGELIPIVFRPFHELTGSWFWWGKDLCSPKEFIALWRFTHDYLTKEKNVHNLIWAYSTAAEIDSEKDFMERYPGDDYVDIVGFDNYQGENHLDEQVFAKKTARCIAIASKVADERNKLYAFMEAGYAKVSPNNQWFTKVLYPLLKDTKCSYVMFWRNACDIKDHYFIPYYKHPAAKDLCDFDALKDICSLNKIGEVYRENNAPYSKVYEKKLAYSSVLLSEITPKGWFKKQIEADMNDFIGNLDKLVPQLLVNDDIYVKNRLSLKDKSKNVGTGWEGGDWEVQCLWWNSESQSNWRDGYVRNAFFLKNKKYVDKITKYINYILDNQDDNGYLGIYEPDLRYNFTGENGELWSKATLYRVLLAYYEFTHEKKVLDAVERAVQDVMDNYRIDASTPFKVGVHYGGVCHGLAFTDVLDKLYQLTGKSKYWDYALFLYKDYSSQSVDYGDVQYNNLMNPAYRLQDHGVHIYEHLRSLTVATFASGNEKLEKALATFLNRIDKIVTPTGGACGDEDILQREADATNIGYEYCSLHELFDSYVQLAQKTGDFSWVDKAENLFYNAGMGARHPQKGAICYLKTDNSYEMTGTRNGKDDADTKQTRYKYSPVHQDAAVCCVPNAGRLIPYYVQNMFVKSDHEIVASLFGSSTLQTNLDGQKVTIDEETEYPYKNNIVFRISTTSPVKFLFKIRIPLWAEGVKCNMPYSRVNNAIVINRKWGSKEVVTVEFLTSPRKYEFKGETFFRYGACVLALPIPAKESYGKEYYPGYKDIYYTPLSDVVYKYKSGDIRKKGTKMKFQVTLYNPKTGKSEMKELIPMKETILRQVTFK